MATAEALLTADEYLLLPDNGQPNELIRGRIVPMNMAAPRHGQICAAIAYFLRRHLEDNDIGHVVSNDSGILTERDPDTVRGADVAFYSYAQVPRGPLPRHYLAVPPQLVFEVRSPTDRWNEIILKVGEYLRAGVRVVCVVDDPRERIHVFRSEDAPALLSSDDEFTLPDVLPGLRVAVRRFFE
jgi:Uma2 family endonuclease